MRLPKHIKPIFNLEVYIYCCYHSVLSNTHLPLLSFFTCARTISQSLKRLLKGTIVVHFYLLLQCSQWRNCWCTLQDASRLVSLSFHQASAFRFLQFVLDNIKGPLKHETWISNIYYDAYRLYTITKCTRLDAVHGFEYIFSIIALNKGGSSKRVSWDRSVT